jgi:ADP-L-glycero-D-manno-heptose 6-epimerase
MYLVTGGAGFIGSNVVAGLCQRGADVAVCDWLGNDERWRNLAKHEIVALVAPEELPAWLQRNVDALDAVIHMGAVSSTTETDVDLLASRNTRSTLDLLDWCTQARMRFIYASSAAIYGDGSGGFDDSCARDVLDRVRPLNAYGWSKLVVDRRIASLARRERPLPPQWVGLRFFNVYGPNEYHKQSMQSVIAKNYVRIRDGEALQLFRSYRQGYADGGQLRDFVYVRDCVDTILWLLEHDHVSGIFNVGTGRARSWLDLALALFAAARQPPNIQFVDMPTDLIAKYQYFTQASMTKLREAGYQQAPSSLEAGVEDYVRHHLSTDDPYR